MDLRNSASLKWKTKSIDKVLKGKDCRLLIKRRARNKALPETAEQGALRLERARMYSARHLANETPEQRLRRLERLRKAGQLRYWRKKIDETL